MLNVMAFVGHWKLDSFWPTSLYNWFYYPLESHQTRSLQSSITFGYLCEYVDLKSSFQPQGSNSTPRITPVTFYKLLTLYPFYILLHVTLL